MRDHLLGYLLKALEPDEHELIERHLEADERLRQDLLLLQRSLEPLAADDELHLPPAGLAQRTCQFVMQRTEIMPAALSPAPTTFTAAAARRWSLLDLTVAAAVMIAAGVLFIPAIHNSRVQAQLTACQNNLQRLGTALTKYSELDPQRRFPVVPEQGKLAVAGVYAPTLVSRQLISDPSDVLCPSSALAAERSFRLPTLEELNQATEQRLAEMRRRMGGSYGYTLGYREDGSYHPVKNMGRTHFALMADAPAPDLRSTNNHVCGQNVLFEAGNVAHLRTCQVEGHPDRIYTNDAGQAAAGLHRDDAVVVSSERGP
jgi:hypothetical protein